MQEQAFFAQLDSRLETLIQSVHDGRDAPPMERYRVEGLMQAAIVLGLADAAALYQRMDELHERVVGQRIADYYADGMDYQPAPDATSVTIPLWMARAPVKPST